MWPSHHPFESKIYLCELITCSVPVLDSQDVHSQTPLPTFPVLSPALWLFPQVQIPLSHPPTPSSNTSYPMKPFLVLSPGERHLMLPNFQSFVFMSFLQPRHGQWYTVGALVKCLLKWGNVVSHIPRSSSTGQLKQTDNIWKSVCTQCSQGVPPT